METAEDIKYINTNKWDFYNKWDFDGMVAPMTFWSERDDGAWAPLSRDGRRRGAAGGGDCIVMHVHPGSARPQKAALWLRPAFG